MQPFSTPCAVSIFQDHRNLQLHGSFIDSCLQFSSTLNIYLNSSKQSPILENFCVLESVGKITDNDISDGNKYLLIQNRAPEKTSEFPRIIYTNKRKTSREIKLHWKHSWFSEFNFICYSTSTDGLFCAACVLFLMSAQRGSRANSLITQPYRNWKDIKEYIKNHCTQRYHKDFM